MTRLVIRPEAAREFVARARHLGKEASPAVARRFQKALSETLAVIAEAPQLGSPWESANPRLAGLRTRPVKRFPKLRVFYTVGEDAVEILHLLHASQDIDGILEETD